MKTENEINTDASAAGTAATAASAAAFVFTTVFTVVSREAAAEAAEAAEAEEPRGACEWKARPPIADQATHEPPTKTQHLPNRCRGR